MKETPEQKAARIIQKILYITVATASKDGKPWNSPVYSASDEDLNFYWASDQNAQHSRNIKENAQVFLVVYDSTVPEGTGEGVYFQAKAQMLTSEEEVSHALEHLYGRVGKKVHEPDKFLSSFPRRVYRAIPETAWVNGSGDVKGNYIDIRVEVNLEKLKDLVQ